MNQKELFGKKAIFSDFRINCSEKKYYWGISLSVNTNSKSVKKMLG